MVLMVCFRYLNIIIMLNMLVAYGFALIFHDDS